MSDTIRSAQDGDITTITIDKPDNGNRVTNAMAAELGAAIDGAGQSKLVILRGAGDVFCLGRDMPPGSEDGNAMDIRAGNTEPALELFAKFQRCPATIIGVVRGKAVGMGCAMAALCDITLAADDASFQVPEMHRDLPPTLVMWALADRIPRKAAAHMVYSQDPIDATTALTLGLVSRVIPAADISRSCRDPLCRKGSERSTLMAGASSRTRHFPPPTSRHQPCASLARGSTSTPPWNRRSSPPSRPSRSIQVRISSS